MRSLRRDQLRAIDARAIAEYGLPGIVLMENAGGNAARLLASIGRPPTPGAAWRVVVVCGRGNNGGDGFVIARHLENLGAEVRILLASSADSLRGDAAANHAVAVRAGIPIRSLDSATPAGWAAALTGSDWIVDALLGTGSTGAPRGAVALAIAAINAARSAGARVLAVDLPSGLDGDSGIAAGACVVADATATFVARKPGFDDPATVPLTGAVHVLDIGVPRRLLDDVAAGR